jgi:hypothetical protein
VDAAFRWLADQLEILNLIARLAHIADDGDLGQYADCYTEDIVWRTAGAPNDAGVIRRGLTEVIAGSAERRAEGTQGPGTHVRHVVSTSELQPDGVDGALGRSYWRMYQNANTAPQIRALGVYADKFVRTAVGWRLAERSIIPG